MITVQVAVFAYLRKYLPEMGIGERLPVQLREGATVSDLLNSLPVPINQVHVVFVNHRICEVDHPLNDNDIIGIFPPVAGG